MRFLSYIIILVLLSASYIYVSDKSMNNIYSNTEYRDPSVLLEAIENYSGSPLYYSIDALTAFRNKVSSASQAVSFTEWYNNLAWPKDWWLPEFGGYNYISDYHYVLFDGHGGITTVSFSVWQTDAWNINRNYADFTLHVTRNNNVYIMVHPNQKTRWITIAACNFLRLDASSKNNLIYYGFNGGITNTQDLSNTYLHGIVGMASNYVDSYVDGWGTRHDLNTPTLTEYANELISGKSFKEAWFNAVHNHQKYGCFLWWCEFQGKPAVIYPVVKECGFGACIVTYDPGYEGMEPFSIPYGTPKQAYDQIPVGMTYVIEWVYEVG